MDSSKEPEPVAVIGLGCRLPGGANDVENLWTALANGESGWAPHRRERQMPELFYHPNPEKKGTFYAKGAHYLEEDVGLFDASFFNITSTEAKTMDPQQRHLLEVSYEAFENAGLSLSSISGSNVGVFIGGGNAEYRPLLQADLGDLQMFDATGTAEALLANRISYFYNFRGPSFTIDTACSSSLVALNSAFQSLQSGESSSALVGSSIIRLTHGASISLSGMQLLSPDGRCYAFDDRGKSGFGRGEGTVCIILKRLSDAIRDGDPIRALVRNTGVNQDGRTNGITMPSGKAQSSLIESVYRSAGLDPLETDYVEAHGTGTATGDPIEAAALSEIFGGRNQNPVIIGSAKSNFGHLEAGSGVVSIIKVVLMLERGFITPNCDLRTLNRRIPFDELNLKVSDKHLPWNTRGVRRASINNFGFGGANAHAVLEESIHPDDIRAKRQSGLHHKSLASTQSSYLCFFSANDQTSLQKTIDAVAEYVIERPTYLYSDLLKSLAFTIGQRRSIFQWKYAVQASSQEDLASKLKDAMVEPVRSIKPPKLGFVFTGQGAGWAQMGIDLCQKYPVYVSTLRKAEEALKSLGATWSLIEELEKPQADSLIGIPQISQPACTALQIALVDLFSSWGLQATGVVGHSSGEIAAAYTAHALSLEKCIAIAYYRGFVSSKMKDRTNRPGTMLVLGTSQEDSQSLIDASRTEDGDATIACINSPNNITISGDVPRLKQISDLADAKSTWNRQLDVGVAYHSSHMNGVAGEYSSLLGNILPKPEEGVDFHSSLTGRKASLSSLTTQYWVDNLVSPVQFTKALSSICEQEQNVDALLEIGPHSALQGPIKQILKTITHNVTSIPSLIRHKDGASSLLDSAANLMTLGSPLNLQMVNFPMTSSAPEILTDLPSYRWNHSTRYWHDTRVHKEMIQHIWPRHDLLGTRTADCAPNQPQWTNHLSVDDAPWLRDHRVQNVTIFPMAGYLCMAVEACQQNAHWKSQVFDRLVLRDVLVQQALMLPEGNHVELRLALTPLKEGPHSLSKLWDLFKISSWNHERGWVDHCQGQIGAIPAMAPNSVATSPQIEAGLDHDMGNWSDLWSSCTRPNDMNHLYEICAKEGFNYGPTFRRISGVHLGPEYKARFTISVADTCGTMPFNRESEYLIHPITLDTLFQGATPFFVDDNAGFNATYLPVSIGELILSTKISNTPGSSINVLGRATPPDSFSRRRGFDYVVRDPNQPDDPCVIVARNVVEVPDQMSAKTQQNTTQRALKVEWSPCQRKSTIEIKHEALSDAESLALFHIKKALEETNDVTSTHLQSLHSWMISAAGKNRATFHSPISAEDQVASNTTLTNGYYISSQFVDRDHGVEPRTHLTNGAETDQLADIDLPKNVTKSSSHRDTESLVLQNNGARIGKLAVKDVTGAEKKSPIQNDTSASSLINDVGQDLRSILSGSLDPSKLFLKYGNSLQYRSKSPEISSEIAGIICDAAYQNPHIRILEINALSTETAVEILTRLREEVGPSCKYVTFDIALSPSASKLDSPPGTQMVSFNSTEDLTSLQTASYDAIIAWNLCYPTAAEKDSVRKLGALLRKNGDLVLANDIIDGDSLASLPYRTLPGWWSNPTGDVTGLNATRRRQSLDFQDTGLIETKEKIFRNSAEAPWCKSLLVTSARSEIQLHPETATIIAKWLPHGMTKTAMESNLMRLGFIRTEWIEFDQLRGFSIEGKYCIVIDNPKSHLLTRLDAGSFEGLKTLTQASGLLWISGGGRCPDGGLSRGLIRVIRAEFQLDQFVTLAVDEWDCAQLLDMIINVIHRSLLQGDPVNREYALIKGGLHISRLMPDNTIDQALAKEVQDGFTYPQPFHQQERALRLTIANPGFLDTLYFVDDHRVTRPIDNDEIEIEVKAMGLNFKDVILALGQLPGNFLGQECSGVVTQVGSAVAEFQIGDRVCAIVPGSIANLGRCKASCAIGIHNTMSFVVAASIPLIYCTAQYCLAHVARLKAGETILIHAAAGGVGQAAIMLAKAFGANILATVGSPEKKDFLVQTFGIAPDCIFYSRDTSFAREVRRKTDGKGVDVALNSLSGEQLKATWRCMAPFGRFIEIGKRDIVSNMNLEMGSFEKTVSFSAVDLGDLIQLQPRALHDVFQEVMDLFEVGSVRSVSPVREFAISDIETAFRTLQSGKLTGKIVIVPHAEDCVKATRQLSTSAIFREDISYLITGGTGGIGRSTCIWMAQNGAKNIILASRSGRKEVKAMSIVDDLAAVGTTVEVYSADVAVEADLNQLISDCSRIMPPIGGVIHGAYVNKDAAFDIANFQDWCDVVRPKHQGAWNLHNLLIHHQLDFFVMLSSISGVIGNRGQAAYAAANSFLDDFAQYRGSRGLPATSLDLGVVKEIGHVAERPELESKLEALSGDTALSEKEVLGLVRLAVTGEIDRQCVAGLSFENYAEENPAFFWATDARFCHLRPGKGYQAEEGKDTGLEIKQALRQARDLKQAKDLIKNELILKLSNVLIVPVETISPDKSVASMGLDSLVAVEVRSWIAKEMSTKVSTMELMTISSVKALAHLIAERSTLIETKS